MQTFTPTTRQQQFRTLVRCLLDDDMDERLDDDGKVVQSARRFTLPDWCRAWRKEHPRSKPVNVREFLSWEQADGFAAWWQDGLPEFSEVTDMEWALAHREFFSQVVTGMHNPKVQQTYLQHAKARADATQGGLSEGLRAWMSSGDAAVWVQGGPVAEAK